jgi:hypothetical protein
MLLQLLLAPAGMSLAVMLFLHQEDGSGRDGSDDELGDQHSRGPKAL